MAASRRLLAAGVVALTAVGGVVSLTSCGGRAEPRSLPPQTLLQDASPESEPAPPPPEPLAEEEEVAESTTYFVIEESQPVAKGPSLVEAAAAERDRRARAESSELKLTDKNLDRYAVGELTTSDPDPRPARTISITGAPASVQPPAEGSAPAVPAAGASDFDLTTNEGHWRNRVLDLRLRWRAAYDSILDLESKVAGLRNQFYAADDPYYRDSQIKPAWDRALENLETARTDVDRYRTELEAVLNDGRRDGALPGWLREGIEHEPPTGQPGAPAPDPSRFSVQPTIYDGGDPP